MEIVKEGGWGVGLCRVKVNRVTEGFQEAIDTYHLLSGGTVELE